MQVGHGVSISSQAGPLKPLIKTKCNVLKERVRVFHVDELAELLVSESLFDFVVVVQQHIDLLVSSLCLLS